MAKQKPAKRATALAKRTPAKQAPKSLMKRKPRPDVGITPAAEAPNKLAERVLDDQIMLGDYGLAEIRFTAEEEAVLSQPVQFEDMRVKPDGAVYISHPVYTRWLNKAFGRTGWALVPAAKPQIGEGTVIVPYRLMIHGKPVAFAYGEQEYFTNNKNQTYGDAIESTQASGLRRCCKRLGLALELWDKSFNDAFLQEHCLQVFNEKTNKYEWRRKFDPPFWWEKKNRGSERRGDNTEDRPPAREQAPVHHTAKANEPISEGQLKRFWALVRQYHRTEPDIKQYLFSLGYEHSKDIKRKDYDTICTAIEHPGDLPARRREPGEEG